MSALSQRRKDLLDELKAKPAGLDWCVRHTALLDEAVRTSYARFLTQIDGVPPFAVIATGGYGRQELAPWSDVDLTIVPLDESHPGLEPAIRTLFKELQTGVGELGLKMGYALRYVSDCPSLDPKTRSGLIDARFIVGSRDAFVALEECFWETFPVAEFVIEKLREHGAQLTKTNDTPLATQPDLKHGAGGLRSFQTANWIGAALGERLERPSRDYDEIAKYRNVLHSVSDRSTDLMTFSKRADIATVVSLEPFELGSRIAGHLSAIEAAYIRRVSSVHTVRFALAKHVESFNGEARILPQATTGQAAIGVARATKLGLSISDVKARPVSGQGASEALSAISAGEATLRNLDTSGVLESLLPELTRCRTLMPQDSSHAFSVFEHTMRVVRNIDSLASDSFLGSIADDLPTKAPLYLAALLHDVGRFESEQHHAEIGVGIAESVCSRWDVYEATKETVCWLVGEHLTFDRILRMRDVANPATAIELASIVKTPERLAMLAVLTWADINAVNDDAWSSQHEAFFRELYTTTLQALSADEPQTLDPAHFRRRLLAATKSTQVPQAELESFLSSMPAHYLVGTEPDLARVHFGLFTEALNGGVSVVLFDNTDAGTTDVTVCCPDSPGLLSRILGVFYAIDLSIVAIRASTSSGEAPVALDTITVSFGGRNVPKATAARLVKTMRAVVGGDTSVADVMREAKKEPDRPQNVLTYHFLPGNPAIVEIHAPRGRGMAYRLARQLAQEGINILSARVGQWAGQGTAAFYVTDSQGGPVDEGRIARAFETPKV